jgi:uridine kinase
MYVRFVKPAFENHIAGTRRWADIILPADNTRGIELISHHLEDMLMEKMSMKMVLEMFRAEESDACTDTEDGIEELMK